MCEPRGRASKLEIAQGITTDFNRVRDNAN